MQRIPGTEQGKKGSSTKRRKIVYIFFVLEEV